MNAFNMMATAAAVRASDEYNQGRWTNPGTVDGSDTVCHTPACIAGHAAALATRRDVVQFGVASVYYRSTRTLVNIEDVAGQFLGLTRGQGAHLFHIWPGVAWPDPFASRWRDIAGQEGGEGDPNDTRHIAADYLEHLAGGGIWSV